MTRRWPMLCYFILKTENTITNGAFRSDTDTLVRQLWQNFKPTDLWLPVPIDNVYNFLSAGIIDIDDNKQAELVIHPNFAINTIGQDVDILLFT